MATSEQTHVEVAVAVVTDASKRVLLIFNDRWGSFTLPMSRRRRGPEASEPSTGAAVRAAAEALGVPVRLAGDGHARLPVRLQSGRELRDKIYSYRIFHIESHPEFDDRLQIRQPYLWLSPHWILSGAYEPISESARFILRSVLAEFDIPVRLQHTSTLIIQRESVERARQFLVRWSPSWGYALPARRWDLPEAPEAEDLAAAALAGAERAAREELGLDPATDASLVPAGTPELTTHGVSQTKDAPAFGEATNYVHHLFDTTLRHAEKLKSARPLAWITEEEVHHGWTAASQGEPGAPQVRSGRISRTTYEILLNLGLIAEAVDPEIENLAREWLKAHGAGLTWQAAYGVPAGDDII
jgi:8-oxo-dGTP pyrophosphatase MutT (NUDIX family)